MNALEKFEKEYALKHRKLTLKKAIEYCEERGVQEPGWVQTSLCEIGRSVVLSVNMTGRKTNIFLDDQLYQTVLDYTEQGLTIERACQLTAKEYAAELKANKNRHESGEADTVKSAYFRHQKRLRFGPPFVKGMKELGYSIKLSAMKHDKGIPESK